MFYLQHPSELLVLTVSISICQISWSFKGLSPSKIIDMNSMYSNIPACPVIRTSVKIKMHSGQVHIELPLT